MTRAVLIIASLTIATFLLVVVAARIARAADRPPDLDEARRLYLSGRYAEVLERFERLSSDLADRLTTTPLDAARDRYVLAALGAARCETSQGKAAAAMTRLQKACRRFDSPPADLLAERAWIAWQRGDADKADQLAQQALADDANQLVARWVAAELLRTTGRLEEADAAYGWFIDYHNRLTEVPSAEDLVWIGRAATQSAHWNPRHEDYRFLLQELYPLAWKREPDYWPARLAAATLLLEKHNQADAAEQLAAARALNPFSADVLAADAKLALENFNTHKAVRLLNRALEIHPQHLDSLLILADVHLVNLDADGALEVLQQARQVNPIHEPTLGRIAAARLLSAREPDAPSGDSWKSIVDQVTQRNPHPGSFYEALAASLELSRKYPLAKRFYARALEVMPSVTGPGAELGLVLMRLGDEGQARALLEKAFRDDPSNVRVRNTLEVLDVLSGYATLETEHFRIRYDAERDEILAQCMADYLEEIYPEFCRRLDHQLDRPALIEIFNRARSTDGHGWFSARMAGVPAIHTVAACGGGVVALTSPATLSKPYRWAQVTRHELVHLFNLQQTDYNVPHWFTEAAAVWMEDRPRPAQWNELLVRRAAAARLYDLGSLNAVFVNPPSVEDWQLAYCQAALYADYFVSEFGPDALVKLLTAYREHRATPLAVRNAFNVELDNLEQGYTRYVADLVARLTDEGVRPQRSLSELRQAHTRDPQDPDVAAELAVAWMRRNRSSEASRLADAVLAEHPDHQLAAYVMAKLLIARGQYAAARELLLAKLDRTRPQPEIVKLLAPWLFEQGQGRQARQLIEAAARLRPRDTSWTKMLAADALQSGDTDRLMPLLERLAEVENADVSVLKKLASLAARQGDHAAAARWAREAVQTDALDAGAHRLFAEALVQLDENERAAVHRSIANKLQNGTTP